MAAEHWFRWHHGTVTDPKWRIVAKRACHTMSRNVTVGHVVAVWSAMLENASQASPRGELANWSDEDVGALFDIEESEVASIREAMQGKTLHGDEVMSWNRRQIKKLDETAAQRKSDQRARELERDNSNVTPCHTSSHSVTVETETETDKEQLQESVDSKSSAFDHVLSAYHEILPKCQRVSVMNPKRKRRVQSIVTLAKSICKDQGWPYEPSGFWPAFFSECAKDPWMRGEVPNPKNPSWKQNLDVLLAEDRFAGVMDKAISTMRNKT